MSCEVACRRTNAPLPNLREGRIFFITGGLAMLTASTLAVVSCYVHTSGVVSSFP